ncbi:MAG: GNAT family N-acyltransferase [Motiliproteus sp.]
MSISFEISKDPVLLERYYNIREECFRRELGVRSFDGGEDVFDLTGKILIVKDGELCIGGARLSSSTSTNPGLLPMEKNGFLILREFPEIAHSNKGYCQWTRLALLPEYRTTTMLRMMTQVMINEVINQGYSYSFGISGLNRSRLYRRLHQAAGYNYEIRRDVKIQEEGAFAGLEHLLSIGYLENTADPLVARSSSHRESLTSRPVQLRIVA